MNSAGGAERRRTSPGASGSARSSHAFCAPVWGPAGDGHHLNRAGPGPARATGAGRRFPADRRFRVSGMIAGTWCWPAALELAGRIESLTGMPLPRRRPDARRDGAECILRRPEVLRCRAGTMGASISGRRSRFASPDGEDLLEAAGWLV